jgi:hypothetical protein
MAIHNNHREGKPMRTIRQTVLIGTTAALIGGGLFIRAVEASGGQDVSHYTVSCDTTTKSKISFVPPLLIGGSSPEVTKIKGTLSGCFATPDGTNPPITVLSGAVSGTLTSPTNDCTSNLLGPTTTTGSITIKWKTVPAITPNTTTLTLASGNLSGITDSPFGDTSTYLGFNLSGAAVSGAFLGADSGASSFTNALTVQGINVVEAECTFGGLKGLNFGPAETNLR